VSIYKLLQLNAPFIFIGFLYELLFTFPHFITHPIRIMGKAASYFESVFLDPSASPSAQKKFGIIAVFLLAITTYIVFDLIDWTFYNTYFLFFIRAFFTVSILAAGSLILECRKVLDFLTNSDLASARHQLSMLVTRDTSRMEEPEICRTTIETLSENLCDGVIAPLFFLFLGGIPLAMAYKMASTLDSMIGYKNKKYLHFGWAAARFDDVLAFIPARISAFCIIIAAVITGQNGINAFRVWKRDRKKTESPNSGQSESAFAGALGIWFGGIVSYFGKSHEKPVIGDNMRDANKEDIAKALRLAKTAAIICLMIFIGAELAGRLR
jgi:adenosylcobinamide-phosphate synthase